MTTTAWTLISLGALVLLKPLWVKLYSFVMPGRATRGKVRNIIKSLYTRYFTLVEEVYFRDEKGETNHLSQVLISRYGIFIIELCHMNETIYGGSSTNGWFSGKDVDGSTLYYFANPHLQLAPVKRSFCMALGIPEFVCHTIVIFTRNKDFRTKNLQRTCKINDLVKKLDQFITYEVGDESHQRIVKQLEMSRQNITTKVKRCIIEANYLKPQPSR